jgi:hypothetical protein
MDNLLREKIRGNILEALQDMENPRDDIPLVFEFRHTFEPTAPTEKVKLPCLIQGRLDDLPYPLHEESKENFIDYRQKGGFFIQGHNQFRSRVFNQISDYAKDLSQKALVNEDYEWMIYITVQTNFFWVAQEDKTKLDNLVKKFFLEVAPDNDYQNYSGIEKVCVDFWMKLLKITRLPDDLPVRVGALPPAFFDEFEYSKGTNINRLEEHYPIYSGWRLNEIVNWIEKRLESGSKGNTNYWNEAISTMRDIFIEEIFGNENIDFEKGPSISQKSLVLIGPKGFPAATDLAKELFSDYCDSTDCMFGSGLGYDWDSILSESLGSNIVPFSDNEVLSFQYDDPEDPGKRRTVEGDFACTIGQIPGHIHTTTNCSAEQISEALITETTYTNHSDHREAYASNYEAWPISMDDFSKNGVVKTDFREKLILFLRNLHRLIGFGSSKDLTERFILEFGNAFANLTKDQFLKFWESAKDEDLDFPERDVNIDNEIELMYRYFKKMGKAIGVTIEEPNLE